jgi:hypothetical protein
MGALWSNVGRAPTTEPPIPPLVTLPAIGHRPETARLNELRESNVDRMFTFHGLFLGPRGHSQQRARNSRATAAIEALV